MIQPIVEGHGELSAVPVLLRRFIEEAGCYDLRICKPIRRNRCQLTREGDVKKAVELALTRAECRAILLIFDADEDCPAEIAPQIKRWAEEAAGGRVHIEVVMISREYEAWFLASIESLRGIRGIKADAAYEGNCEEVPGAKEALSKFVTSPGGYHETTDQPALTQHFNIRAAFERARSFRKMVRAFSNIVASLGRHCPYPLPSCSGACQDQQ